MNEKKTPPLVEYVADNHVNLKNVDKMWVGGWWVPVPEDAKKYVLQAVRGAYLQGKRDRTRELRALLALD